MIAGLGSQSMVAQAASIKQISFPLQNKQVEYCQNGNKFIISYGNNCNIQDILGQLGNCFPSVNLPGTDCPEIPEGNNPGTGTPETEKPEVNIPGTGTPENNNPGNNGSTDTTPESPEEDSSDSNIHPYVKKVVDLVNEARAKEGLSPLTLNSKVQAAAQVRATECERLFSHTRPDGSSFATALKEQNVSYRRAGENIAWGQRTPEQVVTGWMNSEGHRANIMNPNFTTIGVGYYQNAKGTNYWCQLFTN
jgi:uncharacterized protein YkwD